MCVSMFSWVWWLVWSARLLRLCVVRQSDRQKGRDGRTDCDRPNNRCVFWTGPAAIRTPSLPLALLILVFISKRKDCSSSLSLTVFHLWERQTTSLSPGFYVALLSLINDALISLLSYDWVLVLPCYWTSSARVTVFLSLLKKLTKFTYEDSNEKYVQYN